MNLSKKIIERVVADLSNQEDNPNVLLHNALRLLAKWRSVLIQNTLIEKEGTKVLQGPLKGLDFIEKSSEGCHIAKLLGSYEQPLQPSIQRAISSSYSVVINVGCAEGYYAVGFAKMMPSIISLAFDTDPHARKVCKQLATKNGVIDRVKVGGLFTPTDFSKYENEDTLVFCDIEGAEEELLDPDLAPALQKMDIIVESHECIRRGITKKLISRFEATHDIELVEDNGVRHLDKTVAWFTQLSHLDQLLSTWEWRSGPTPWLVMHAKSP